MRGAGCGVRPSLRLRLAETEAAKGGGHRARREALAQEELVDAGALLNRGRLASAAQLLLDRAIDHGAFVEVAEYFADSFCNDVARDAHRLQLARDTQPSASLDLRRRARVRARDAPVVQRSAGRQPFDRRVDFIRRMLPIRKPRAQIRRRKFSAAKKLQPIVVSGHGEIPVLPQGARSHRRVVNRAPCPALSSVIQGPNGTSSRGRLAVRAVRELLLWALSLMLVSVFLRAGHDKLDDGSGWSRAFAVWGYPAWFRVLVGIVELSAAILILWPRTAAYAAILIIVVMLGGMGTHIVIEHRPARVTSEALQLAFSSIVLAGRWRRRIPILPG